MRNRIVRYIQVDVSYYEKCYTKIKYYPKKKDKVNIESFREDDGFWFGLDLDDNTPINIHLFFSDRKWNTNCEYCERDADGNWNHVFDHNIYVKTSK